MPKRTIASFWIAGGLIVLPALILVPASLFALTAHLDQVSPGDWTNPVPDAYSRNLAIGLGIGVVLIIVGAVVQFSAWLGALVNLDRLKDRTWYDSLLLSGVLAVLMTPALGIGTLLSVGAMTGYLVGGPDAIDRTARSSLIEKRRMLRWAVAGAAAIVAGLLVALLVTVLSGSGGPFNGLRWTALTLEWAGLACAWVGVLAVTAAWWGAIFNSDRLHNRTWFRRLLWGGIIAIVGSPLFGAGPVIGIGILAWFLGSEADGLQSERRQPAPPSAAAPAPG